MSSVSVFVIEPDDLQRALACALVEQVPELDLVGDAGDLVADAGPAESDLILINAWLVRRRLVELQAMARNAPGLRYVCFEKRPVLDVFLDALSLPVSGLLSLNHLSSDEFMRALRTISLGGAVIEPVAAQELIEYLRQNRTVPAEHAAPDSLTGREAEVLRLVQRGLANKEVAMRLDMGVGTVRAHLRAIFRKLDVTSRTAAAAVLSPSPMPELSGPPARW